MTCGAKVLRTHKGQQESRFSVCAALRCSSADRANEKLWHMPLVARYKELLESKCADLNNVGGKGKGGAITAAVFLKQFVETVRLCWLGIP